MIDRRNRQDLTLLGLVLMAAGGVSAAVGGGVFDDRRAHQAVFDRTVVRWWEEGGWESFAVVTAIGAALVIVGAVLVGRQLHRNDNRTRTPDVGFPQDGTRGETTLRSPALSHSLQADLETIPDVSKALVGLFGRYPTLEMRALITVGDTINLDGLPARVDEVLQRMKTTSGVRPETVRVTLRFKAAHPERQLA